MQRFHVAGPEIDVAQPALDAPARHDRGAIRHPLEHQVHVAALQDDEARRIAVEPVVAEPHRVPVVVGGRDDIADEQHGGRSDQLRFATRSRSMVLSTRGPAGFLPRRATSAPGAHNDGTCMNRLIELPPEQQTPEQKKVFDQHVAGRGRILGPYKIWIHSPTVASGSCQAHRHLPQQQRHAVEARGRDRHSPSSRAHWKADYVQTAHVREGRRVGLSDDIVNAHHRAEGAAAHRSARVRRVSLRRRAGPRHQAPRTPTSPRSRRRSAVLASPKFSSCSATTLRLESPSSA